MSDDNKFVARIKNEHASRRLQLGYLNLEGGHPQLLRQRCLQLLQGLNTSGGFEVERVLRGLKGAQLFNINQH